jgi:hypothetical protein
MRSPSAHVDEICAFTTSSIGNREEEKLAGRRILNRCVVFYGDFEEGGAPNCNCVPLGRCFQLLYWADLIMPWIQSLWFFNEMSFSLLE